MVARSYWLLVSGRRIELGEFPLLVGRDPSCDLVLEGDPLVSRRHACFTALDGAARVEDLRSRNGVYVNGARIDGEHSLEGGERVRVGTHTFEVRSEELPSARGPSETTQVDRRKGLPSVDTITEKVEPTGDANIFELLSGVAEKAFRMGNSQEAERVLRPCLDMVWEEAERRGQLDSVSLQHASRFACRLAAETGDGQWFDYVVRLHRRIRRPPAAHVVDQLYELCRRVKRVDLEVLRGYARDLAAQREQFGASDKFLVGRIEGLARLAAT